MPIRKTISNQAELQNYFKNSSIFLVKNSKITFYDDLILESNICFEGKIFLGKRNKVSNNCKIKDSKIGSNNNIQENTIITDSVIFNYNNIGPFSFIRANSKVGNSNRIGTFVEIARSEIKNYVQISHMSFLGDILLGSKVIIGAGVITANFYKNKRNKTTIGQNTLIGCNTVLIAPIIIGSQVIVAAGSNINFNIGNKKKVIQKKETSIIN